MAQNYVHRVDSAHLQSWPGTRWHKTPNPYVEIWVGDRYIGRTRTEPRSTKPKWNETFFITSHDGKELRETLSIKVMHEPTAHVGRAKFAGGVSVELTHSSTAAQHSTLTLTLEAEGSRTRQKPRDTIVVELNAHNLPKVAAMALAHSHGAAGIGRLQGSVAALLSAVLPAIDDAYDAYEGNDPFLGALGLVVTKLGGLITILDRVATVHPYINLAWQATSCLYKAVQSQMERDKQLIDLARSMRDVYTFVDDVEGLQHKQTKMEELIRKILLQTVECTIFIKEYTGKGFSARAVQQTISSEMSERIDAMKRAFKDLQQSFNSGLILHNAFVSSQILDGVQSLQRMECLKRLRTDSMNASSHPVCLPGTRKDILNRVSEWVLTPSPNQSKQNIFWLYGVAGSGKSTIANTVAQQFNDLGRLGAFLLFDRNDSLKSEPAAFVRRLADQLRSFCPAFETAIASAVKQERGVAQQTLRAQFMNLIVEPLMSVSALADSGPILIVLDGLDECGNLSSRKNHDILTLMSQEFNKLPQVFRILITSRPEYDINSAFDNLRYIAREEILGDVEGVSMYLRHHLKAVRSDRKHGLPENWPGESAIKELVMRSAGVFVWAATAIRYIDCGYMPHLRLNDLLQSESRSVPQEALNDIYNITLQNAGEGNWDNKIFVQDLRNVLGVVVVGRIPLSDSTLDLLLDLKGDRSSKFVLPHLRCLLHWSEGSPVRTLHASFAEYLTNPSKCSSKQWFIPTAEYHNVLLNKSLTVMENLHFNMCNLESSYRKNSDVAELDNRIKAQITEDVAYACQFWADHLVELPFSLTILQKVKDILYTRFLYWLEVLSFLKVLSVGIMSMNSVLRWLNSEDVALEAFVLDAKRFISTFQKPISESTPHIYLSCLPFAPRNSLFARHYRSHVPYTLTVNTGALEDWRAEQLVLEGHTESVNAVAFSPDGRRIVSCSDDCSIIIWDAETGDILVGLSDAHSNHVTAVAYSPDGKKLVSCSDDGCIRIWGAENGETITSLGPLPSHSHAIQYLALSPDNRQILSLTKDGEICVWDATEGTDMHKCLNAGGELVTSATFSPDGKCILSGTCNGKVSLSSSVDRSLVRQSSDMHGGSITCIAISQDGRRVVSGYSDNMICMWNAEDLTIVHGPLKGHIASITSVTFSADSKFIASSSHDHTICVWNVSTGEIELGPLRGHTDRVSSVMFSKDGKHLVSGAVDQTIRVWSTETHQAAPKYADGPSPFVNSVASSPDGKYIVSGALDTLITLRDIEKGEVLYPPLKGHTQAVKSVAFSRNGGYVLSAGADSTICIWEVKTGILRALLKGHTGSVNSAEFSPDGNYYVVSGSDDKTIRVWYALKGNELLKLKGHTQFVSSVAFSPEGNCIASGSGDRTIRLWNAKNGAVLHEGMSGHTNCITSIVFSPEGKYLASGSDDFTVRIWDVLRGCVAREPFRGHHAEVTSVVFSRDGNFVISGSWDKSIRVWNFNTGDTVLGPLQNHTLWMINSVAMSPKDSDQYLLSGSNDGTVRKWHINEQSTTIDWDLLDRSSLDLSSGWVLGPNQELVFWVPQCHRDGYQHPRNSFVFGSQSVIAIGFETFVHGRAWTKCHATKS